MKLFRLVQVGGDDRDDPVELYLEVGGKKHQLAYATYDEHGSAGQGLVTDVAKSLSRALGVELEYDDGVE